MLITLIVIVAPLILASLWLGLHMQSELSLIPQRASTLKNASWICLMLLAVYCLIMGNVIGVVLGGFIAARWTHFQMQRNWANQLAAELELIWLLALTIKSQRSLSDEILMYAGGTTGTRQRRLLHFANDLNDGAPLLKCMPYDLFCRPTALQLQSALNSSDAAKALTELAIAQAKSLNDRRPDLGYSVFAYPIALVSALVLICGFLMYYIVPKFKKIFEDFGTELPDSTIMAINASDFFVNYWYLFAAPLTVIIWQIRRYLAHSKHTSEGAAAIHLLGRFFVRMHAPEILRSLSTAIASGQSITDAVNVFGQQPGPRLIQSTIEKFLSRVQQGDSAWTELYRLGVIRNSERNVIEAAGRIGNLPWVLNTLADNLERRWAFRFNVTGAFLHPVLILAISIPIGGFVLAMFMPMVKLLNDLS